MPCESPPPTTPVERARAREPDGHGFRHHCQSDAQSQERERESRPAHQRRADAGNTDQSLNRMDDDQIRRGTKEHKGADKNRANREDASRGRGHAPLDARGYNESRDGSLSWPEVFAVTGGNTACPLFSLDEECAGELDVDGHPLYDIAGRLDAYRLAERQRVLTPRRDDGIGVSSQRIELLEEPLNEHASFNGSGLVTDASRVRREVLVRGVDVDADADHDPRDTVGLPLHLGENAR